MYDSRVYLLHFGSCVFGFELASAKKSSNSKRVVEGSWEYDAGGVDEHDGAESRCLTV